MSLDQKNIYKLMCWHNGKFKQLKDVCISVFDFGFIHSDGTYEVFRSINGDLKFYNLHLHRFYESCYYFGFKPISSIKTIVKTLLEKNNLKDAFIWLCIWRGTPPTGNPRDLSAPQNSLIYIKPYYNLTDKSSLRLTVEHSHRRVPSACYEQKFKNFGWIELTFAQKTANEKNYDSGIVLNVEGYISEGPGFGVCFIKNGTVITPKKDCLSSVTINIVETICIEHSISFLRKNITPEEAYSCQESFVCSTSGGITPVLCLDHVNYKFDVSLKIQKAYHRLLD